MLSVRAQGSAAETILYGIELPSTAAVVFVVDLNSGDITVGPNGTDRLVIQVSPLIAAIIIFTELNYSLVPRPPHSFCRLQYEKSGRA